MQVPTSCSGGVYKEKYADKIMICLVLWGGKMTGAPSFTPPKLLDQVRDRRRVKHYSIRMETQYLQWIRRLSCSMTNVSRAERTLSISKIKQTDQGNYFFIQHAPCLMFGKSIARFHLSEKTTGTVTQARTG